MAVMRDVLDAVEVAFRETARGRDPWPDPHAGRPAAPDAYSRLTEPERYRIVGARADAWRSALVGLGLADVGTSPARWATPPGTVLTGAETVVPRAPGALPLVLARSAIGRVPDAVARILARPDGWDELSGASWLVPA